MTMRPVLTNRPRPTHKCNYCDNQCLLRFVFCYQCSAALPEGLQKDITRTFQPHLQINPEYDRAINAAWAYLNAEDKNAYIWEKARECAGWAMDELEARGELSNDEIIAMVKTRAKEIEENWKHE